MNATEKQTNYHDGEYTHEPSRTFAKPSEARKELEVGRNLLSNLGRGTGYHFVSGEGELLDYGWTEWLHARIILDEAEALILYDPIFPADPFAP
jgi:hypothetical protein